MEFIRPRDNNGRFIATRSKLNIFVDCACGCGELLEPTDKYGRPHKYIVGHARRGITAPEEEYYSRRGSGLTPKGYLRFGHKLEHRKIFERYYNCCLLPWIDIHHINKNKQDNRIENLQPIKHNEHTKIHRNIYK